MMARVREERFLERAGAHRLLELGGRAESGEPATIQHGDAIARLGLFDVVRGEEHGETGRGSQGTDLLPQRAARAWVEPGRGLVEKQDAGLMEDAAGDVGPAPHAPRTRPHPTLPPPPPPPPPY